MVFFSWILVKTKKKGESLLLNLCIQDKFEDQTVDNLLYQNRYNFKWFGSQKSESLILLHKLTPVWVIYAWNSVGIIVLLILELN